MLTSVDDVRHRHAKEAVTIRLDSDAKAQLAELAQRDARTVSSLIDMAVREYLDRQLGVTGSAHFPTNVLRIRHAALPDTSVLHAFHLLAQQQCTDAQRELKLPAFEFLDDRAEWSRLPADLLTGESDLVESINWLAIFWHMRRGGSSPRLDWTGPFLQLFAGHCVFIRSDLATAFLSAEQIAAFTKFRDEAKSGKDLSLRSLVAWVRQTDDRAVKNALDALWAEAVVGCQVGTDYHIAIRRVTAILGALTATREERITDPTITGVVNLDHGFREFCNGTVTAFTGNLLHSADLLTRRNHLALLIAGPADVRVPSLNTLAARKGTFDPLTDGSDRTGALGTRVLELWRRAVRWFRTEVINAESDDMLRDFIAAAFPDTPFLERLAGDSDEASPAVDPQRLQVLKNLLQTWVRWFEDPNEARAFVGDAGLATKVAAEDLVQHYQELCEMLNPSAQMIAPGESEQPFWRFPVLSERGAARRVTTTSRRTTARRPKPPVRRVKKPE